MLSEPNMAADTTDISSYLQGFVEYLLISSRQNYTKLCQILTNVYMDILDQP